MTTENKRDLAADMAICEAECYRQTHIITELYDELSRNSDTIAELEAEVAQLREQRDHWRREAKDTNLLNAELEAECVGHKEQNRKLSGMLTGLLGLIDGGYITIAKNPSAVGYIIDNAKEALNYGGETAQENNG